MCKMFDELSIKIQDYCISNGLDFEKAKKMCKGCGKDFMFLQYYDPNGEKKGLLNETPMPLVLMISKQADGSLMFEQTEHTRKYLS